jgi:hypothetical protein
MNRVEKQLRYQSVQKLNRMKREGAKPQVVEQMRRSIAGSREHQQKGPVLGPKGKGF